MVSSNVLKRTETQALRRPRSEHVLRNVGRPRTEHELLRTSTVVNPPAAPIKPKNEGIRKGSRQRMPVADEYRTQAPRTSSDLRAYPHLRGDAADRGQVSPLRAPENQPHIATSRACRRQPRPAVSSGENTQRFRTTQRLGPAGGPRLPVDVPEVVSDALVGNPEATGYLLVPEALFQSRQHIQFP